ncbi:MAG: hypothetical protein A3F40_00240 [Chlamydiae bacterium RIFCSPHIGHO2_12_FULL_27_8]|nr:MAG: hypothetical protein A3F40_00240 [Chlamydiae bacterium RIFCSPHIGHO2_12_FULL_27_8]
MQIEIFVLGPLENNTFLIICEKTNKAAVIDPSFGALKALKKYTVNKNIFIEKILLTHSHFDHIYDVNKIKTEYSALIYIHELDVKNLTDPGSDNIFSDVLVEKVIPDVLLKGGEQIKIGEIILDVIHTPGHTPGGICFLSKKDKILFSGDTLFKGTYGRIDFPTSNREDMINSLKKLSQLDKETIVYPGHFNSTSISNESWLNNFEKLI